MKDYGFYEIQFKVGNQWVIEEDVETLAMARNRIKVLVRHYEEDEKDFRIVKFTGKIIK